MKIILKRADGRVSVMTLLAGAPEAAIEQWKLSADPAWLPLAGVVEVADDAVPEDRTFRSAWGHDLKVDVEKARVIAREQMQVRRAQEAVKAIVVPEVDAAASLDDLKNVLKNG